MELPKSDCARSHVQLLKFGFKVKLLKGHEAWRVGEVGKKQKTFYKQVEKQNVCLLCLR